MMMGSWECRRVVVNAEVSSECLCLVVNALSLILSTANHIRISRLSNPAQCPELR